MGVRTVRRLPHVDRVGVEERAATLAKRSIKTEAKRQGIRLAVSMLDLTTLEGADTPGKVRQLCRQGRLPGARAARDPVAAPRCASTRRWWPSPTRRWPGTGVHVASVATAFPSGQSSLDVSCPTRARRWRPAPTRSTW